MAVSIENNLGRGECLSREQRAGLFAPFHRDELPLRTKVRWSGSRSEWLAFAALQSHCSAKVLLCTSLTRPVGTQMARTGGPRCLLSRAGVSSLASI